MRAGVTFLGHSTVLVELGGVRLLTDPVLFDRLGIASAVNIIFFPLLVLVIVGLSRRLLVVRGAA